MPTSNSRYFHYVPAAPLENVGWEVRVLDHGDFVTTIAVVPDFKDLSIGPELNAAGAGSITMDADSPFWATSLPDGRPATTLLDYECLWEAYENGQLRFQWLGTNVQEQLIDDGEVRGIVVSGPGSADVLKWACVLRPGFPAPLRIDPAFAPTGYFWQFPFDWAAMKMWLKLLEAAQSRGTVPWIKPMFTATADSGGNPWVVVQTPQTVSALPGDGYKPDPGANLLDLLDIHTGQDLSKQFAMRAEWYMRPGFNLDVRQVIGKHRESQVIFYEGGVEQTERSRARGEIANYIVAVDVQGDSTLAADSASITRWNKREQLQNRNANVTDPARRNALAQIYLEQTKDENSQWTIKVPYDQPGRRVFVDYDLGDWIGVSRFTPATGASVVEAYRVKAIVINVRDGEPTLELTLQSKQDQKQRDIQKRLTDLIYKVGDHTLIRMPDVDIPRAPTYPTPVLLYPNGRFRLSPWPITGNGGGVRVFIQSSDPASLASPGDFWYDPLAVVPAPAPPNPPFVEPGQTPGERHMELEGHPLH